MSRDHLQTSSLILAPGRPSLLSVSFSILDWMKYKKEVYCRKGEGSFHIQTELSVNIIFQNLRERVTRVSWSEFLWSVFKLHCSCYRWSSISSWVSIEWGLLSVDQERIINDMNESRPSSSWRDDAVYFLLEFLAFILSQNRWCRCLLFCLSLFSQDPRASSVLIDFRQRKWSNDKLEMKGVSLCISPSFLPCFKMMTDSYIEHLVW